MIINTSIGKINNNLIKGFNNSSLLFSIGYQMLYKGKWMKKICKLSTNKYYKKILKPLKYPKSQKFVKK
jgi:hypothetical protein